MNRKNLLWILLDLVFVVLFNAFFFAIGGVEHNGSVWLSYAFIHLSYLMVVLTPVLARGKNPVVAGFPLLTISTAYFLLELLIGMVLILIAFKNILPTLLVQLLIGGIYAALLIPNLLANEHTADAEETRQAEIDYVKNAASELSTLLETINDREVKRKVERVYDEINSSATKSNPQLASLEAQILIAIRDLKVVADDNDKASIIKQADALLIMVIERNRKLKTMH